MCQSFVALNLTARKNGVGGRRGKSAKEVATAPYKNNTYHVNLKTMLPYNGLVWEQLY